jgi:hypothetical protein
MSIMIPHWLKVSLVVVLVVGGATLLSTASLIRRYRVTIHNATDAPLLINGLGVMWEVLPPDGEAHAVQLPLLDSVAGGLDSPSVLRAWAVAVIQQDAELVFCQDGLTSNVLDEEGRRVELERGHLDPHGWCGGSAASKSYVYLRYLRQSGTTSSSGAS